MKMNISQVKKHCKHNNMGCYMPPSVLIFQIVKHLKMK